MMAFFKVISTISSALVIAAPDILDFGIQVSNIKAIDNNFENVGIFDDTQARVKNGKIKLQPKYYLLRENLNNNFKPFLQKFHLFLFKIHFVLRFKLALVHQVLEVYQKKIMM